MPVNYIPKIVYNSITINFTYPPETDDGEQTSADVQTSVAIAGDMQTVYNHLEITRAVTFSLLKPSEFAALQTFFTTWAALGKSFDYYESNNDSTHQTYTLDPSSFSLNAVRQTYSGAQSGFLSQVQLVMRRAA